MIVVMMIMMMLGKLLFSEKLDVLVREKKACLRQRRIAIPAPLTSPRLRTSMRTLFDELPSAIQSSLQSMCPCDGRRLTGFCKKR